MLVSGRVNLGIICLLQDLSYFALTVVIEVFAAPKPKNYGKGTALCGVKKHGASTIFSEFIL